VNATVKPGEQAAAASGMSSNSIPKEQLQNLRFRVDGAKIAE
jgi:hypothetical protein